MGRKGKKGGMKSCLDCLHCKMINSSRYLKCSVGIWMKDMKNGFEEKTVKLNESERYRFNIQQRGVFKTAHMCLYFETMDEKGDGDGGGKKTATRNP